MMQLSTHKEPLFRAAMAWALGFVKDPRATPVLETLGRDLTPVVRKRALKSLLALESDPVNAEPVTAEPAHAVQSEETMQVTQSEETMTALPEAAEEEPESADELNLFGGFSSYKK